MQNPPLNDKADLRFYTNASLKLQMKQFDGDLRLISFIFTVLSSTDVTFAVLRAFLNGCKDRKTVTFSVLIMHLFSQGIAAADAHGDCGMLFCACSKVAGSTHDRREVGRANARPIASF